MFPMIARFQTWLSSLGIASPFRREALLWPIVLFAVLELGVYSVWRYVQTQDLARLHHDTRLTAEQVSIRLEHNLAARLATLALLRDDWQKGDLLHEIAFRERVTSLRQALPGVETYFIMDAQSSLLWIETDLARAELVRADLQPSLTAALTKATAQQDFSATAPLKLNNGVKAVFVYLPAFVAGELRGYVGAMFRLETVAATALGADFDQRFISRIMDGSEIVYARGRMPEAFANESLRPIRFADRVWPLVLAPRLDQYERVWLRADQLAFLLGSLLVAGVAALLRLFLLRQAEVSESEQRFRQMTELLPDMVCELDSRLNLMYANRAACRAFGIVPGELEQGVSLLQLLAPTSAHDIQQLMPQTRDPQQSRSAIIQAQRKDGLLFPCEATFSPVVNDKELITGYRAVMRDITERRQTERRIQRLAHYDALTDLPNRILFRDRLLQAMARAQRNNSHLVVMMVDLDRFKGVNDVVGQSNGDLVIQAVGERLLKLIRKTDTLARTGGDEFMLIAADITSQQDVGNVATRLAQQLQEELLRPFNAGGNEASLTASVGMTLYPKDSASADDLMRHAEAAMYHSKASGRNTFTFYSNAMHSVEKDRVELENRLRRALEQGEFLLHYQPQWDLDAGRIVGAEVLLRWQDGERGLVSPMEFIPQVEEAGMSNALGEWVLRAACRQYAQWRAQGLVPGHLGVNLSASQFRSSDLVRWVEWVLRETQMPPQSLELEVTETTLMEDANVSLENLRRLDALGVRLAIDDFGTGYSSLSYLKRFPIHAIKIDQTFVRDMDSDQADTAIVSAAISMANSLGLSVVAEGVESEQQLALLRSLGCRYAQGYLFARPEPAEVFYQRLRAQPPYT
jgi:diguanylate cyclase (GGDEF)-like protein/PAS domain S-box-containing protein